MTSSTRTPLYRDEDHEFLGFIVKEAAGWQAQTIFGYTISRTTTRKDAEAILHQQGLLFLTGTWQYFDKDDQEWHPCVIKEANEHRVTVIRTNILGFQDPDVFKMVTLTNPSENQLVKSS